MFARVPFIRCGGSRLDGGGRWEGNWGGATAEGLSWWPQDGAATSNSNQRQEKLNPPLPPRRPAVWGLLKWPLKQRRPLETTQGQRLHQSPPPVASYLLPPRVASTCRLHQSPPTYCLHPSPPPVASYLSPPPVASTCRLHQLPPPVVSTNHVLPVTSFPLPPPVAYTRHLHPSPPPIASTHCLHQSPRPIASTCRLHSSSPPVASTSHLLPIASTRRPPPPFVRQLISPGVRPSLPSFVPLRISSRRNQSVHKGLIGRRRDPD